MQIDDISNNDSCFGDYANHIKPDPSEVISFYVSMFPSLDNYIHIIDYERNILTKRLNITVIMIKRKTPQQSDVHAVGDMVPRRCSATVTSARHHDEDDENDNENE